MGDSTEHGLFAHDEPGPRFARADLVRALRATGVPETTAIARLNNFVKRRQIHLRDAPGTHRRFAATDMGAALVLSAILDAGVDDQEIINAASRALYAHNGAKAAQEREKKIGRFSVHPIGWALAGVHLGENWVFTLEVWRDAQTERRLVLADLTRADLENIWWSEPPETALPIAAITCVLDAQLLPAVRMLSPLPKAN